MDQGTSEGSRQTSTRLHKVMLDVAILKRPRKTCSCRVLAAKAYDELKLKDEIVKLRGRNAM